MTNADAFEITVPFLYQAKRMDSYLAGALDGKYSRQQIKEALEAGLILHNGQPGKPSLKVNEGDKITGRIAGERHPLPQAEAIDISVVYEDDDVLVVDKPAGLVVHPAPGHKKGTLVHGLLGRGKALSSLGGAERPGIVHRLDKETSGLLVVAKNNRSHRLLQAQFADRSLSRTYIALVKGKVSYEQGRVNASIGRHPKQRLKMAVSTLDSAREAETHYRVLKRFAHATLLELKLMTGRTHQIRVHMAHLGHPVIGDELYGSKGAAAIVQTGAHRHALHACKLQFVHPRTGNIMKFESPTPQDFKAMVEQAGG